MADPNPEEKYMHHVGTTHELRESLEDSLQGPLAKKGGKVDKEALIKKIMDSAEKTMSSLYPGTGARDRLSREDVAGIVSDLERALEKAGKITSQQASEIANNYVQQAVQTALGEYNAGMRELSIEDARKSVKAIASFLGMDNQHPDIEKTINPDTLFRRVQQRYHPTVAQRTTERVAEGDYNQEKGGYKTFKK
jgi:hypothetical protein